MQRAAAVRVDPARVGYHLLTFPPSVQCLTVGVPPKGPAVFSFAGFSSREPNPNGSYRDWSRIRCTVVALNFFDIGAPFEDKLI